MKHYTKEELELYRNGKMSVLGKILCSVHLKKCKKCADLLAELTEDDLIEAENELSKIENRPLCDGFLGKKEYATIPETRFVTKLQQLLCLECSI